jgi:hypothetical protein
MSNSPRRSINYTPRFTDKEAFDLCPPEVRAALNDSVSDWSAAAALRHSKKYGWKRTVQWLREGDEFFMSKKNWDRDMCPTKLLKLRPLRANW